jgi:hypothetical protein
MRYIESRSKVMKRFSIIINTMRVGAVLTALFLEVFMAAGCGEDGCPVCATCLECPACTLVTSIEIEPAVDGIIYDGGEGRAKDSVADWIVPNTKLLVKNNMSSYPEHNIEVRSIMEFDITSISGTVDEASLELVRDGWENSPDQVILVLRSYPGDMEFKMNDYNRGFPVDTMYYDLGWVVTFDVSDAIRSHIAAGDTCVGFTLRIDPPTNFQTNEPAVVFRSISAGPPPRIKVTQSEIIEPE